MDQLMANLLDLLFELEGRRIPIMIGGGYGLFLKRRNLAATGERTLLGSFPEARATNDLDMFLHAEVLSDLDRTREVRFKPDFQLGEFRQVLREIFSI